MRPTTTPTEAPRNDWNVNHVAEHGITPDDAEHVVEHPHRGYPRYEGDAKYLVRGRTTDGYYIQVIYTFSPPRVVYVIHARPLDAGEKRKLKRRRR